MKDIDKPKEQLLTEIDQLKNKIADLEKSSIRLANNEEKYRLIFEGAYDGILNVDKHAKVLNVNPAFTKITGIPKDQVIGRTGFELAKRFVDIKQLPNILNIIKSAFTKMPIKPYKLNFNDKVLEISTSKIANGQLVGIIRDVTKRRHAEIALKESEEQLKIIFDNSPYAIFLGGLDGTVLDGNRAAEEILGYKTENVAGKNIYNTEFTDISNFPKITKALAKSVLGKKTGPEVYVANRKDGKQVFVEISTYPVKIKNKPVILGVGQDVTQRILTENSLRESEEKYRSLFEQSADPILIIKGKSFVDCNQAAINIIGFKNKAEFLKAHPSQLSPEFQGDGKNSFEKAEEMMTTAYEKGSHRFEWLHRRKNGEVFPVEVLLTAVYGGKEKFLHVVWRDITDRKKAEEALLKSEQQYRNFFEKDISGIFLSTPEGKILDFNPAFAFIIGYSPEEILKMNTTKLYPNPNDRKIFLTKLREDKVLTGIELDLVRKDGEIIHCIENVVGDFDENEQLIRFRGYLMDITKRKQYEESLLDEYQFNEQILHTAMDGFILTETDGKVLKVNPSYCNMVGYSAQELLSMNIRDIQINLSAKEYNLRVKSLIAKGSDQFETCYRAKDGRIIDLNVSIAITRKKDKPLIASFVKNITGQKKAELTIKESEQKLRNILENSTNLFYSHTPDHKLTYFSPNVKDTLGYTEDEALVKWTQMTSDNPINELGYEHTQRAIDTGKKQPPYELELVKKSGEKIWVEVREAPVVANGRTTSIVGALIDITDRKNSERALKESEYLLRESQKVSHLGSYILDFFSGLWKSSDTLFDIFGIDKGYRSDIDGWLNIVHPDDREMMQTYFSENILENFEAFDKEYRIIRQNDKKERWVQGLGRLEFDTDGIPIKMIGTIQDITERKLFDEALIESEAKYRSLIENSNDAIYLLYDDKFEVINDKFSEMFGYTLDEINKPGFGYSKLVSPKSQHLFIERMQQFQEGNLSGNKYEITLVTKKGKEIEVEISDSFINYKNGKANQGYIRDITARKKQQEVLMNAIVKVQEDEKYKFGKELHDGLGQVLISASMYLESLAKLKKELNDNKRKDLEQAQKLNKQAITDARRISHGLMITGIDEHGILYLIKQLCYNSGGPEITFRFSHKDVDEEKINADNKVHLYRIVQELITNIIKHASASRANIKLIFEDNDNLKLIVSDNGKGFEVNKVTYGAGIRNIDQRIKIMKGSKEIRSEKGKGATIIISIPLY